MDRRVAPRLYTPRRLAVVVVLWALALPGPALHAQLPTIEGPTASQMRAEYIAYFMGESDHVITGWEDSWRNDDPGLLAYYAPKALLIPPEGVGRRLEDTLPEYLRAILPQVSGPQLNTNDVVASEQVGVLFGRYTLDGIVGTRTAGSDQGRHVTVLVQRGREWYIRNQLFITGPTGAPAMWRSTIPGEPLPVMTRESWTSGNVRRDQTFTAILSEVTVVLGDFVEAWQAGDLEAMKNVLDEDALLMTPAGLVMRTRDETLSSIRAGGSGFSSRLLTAPLDYVAGGNVAFLQMRYVSEGLDLLPEEQSGRMVMVFQRGGRDWHVRMIVFAPQPT